MKRKQTSTPVRTQKKFKTTPRPVYNRLASSIEKKYLDTSVVNTADVSAGVVLNSLNLVPQGTTDVTRIGNKITIKNININGYASRDDAGTAGYGSGNLRIIIYIDKQANGATAAVTDILKTAAIESYRNMDQVDRFVILKDKLLPIRIPSTNALHTDAGNVAHWRISKKCNIPVHFSSTTGAITELRSNNIGLLYISDNSGVNAASLGVARVKFTDD